MIGYKHQDSDPQDTQEWIESIRSILDTSGTERTHFILEKLIKFSIKNNLKHTFGKSFALWIAGF